MKNLIIDKIKENINYHRLKLPILNKEIGVRPLKNKEVKYLSQNNISKVLIGEDIKKFKNYREYKKEYEDKIFYYKNVLKDVIREDIDIDNLSFLDFSIIIFFLKQISNAMSVDVNFKCEHCESEIPVSIYLNSDDIKIINSENLNGFVITTKKYLKGLPYYFNFCMKNPNMDVYSKILYVFANKNVDSNDKKEELEDLILELIYDNIMLIEFYINEEKIVMEKDSEDENKKLTFIKFKEYMAELYDKFEEKIISEFLQNISSMEYKKDFICMSCGKKNERVFEDKSFF